MTNLVLITTLPDDGGTASEMSDICFELALAIARETFTAFGLRVQVGIYKLRFCHRLEV
jgi:hypothetical protein